MQLLISHHPGSDPRAHFPRNPLYYYCRLFIHFWPVARLVRIFRLLSPVFVALRPPRSLSSITYHRHEFPYNLGAGITEGIIGVLSPLESGIARESHSRYTHRLFRPRGRLALDSLYNRHTHTPFYLGLGSLGTACLTSAFEHLSISKLGRCLGNF